MTFLLPLTFLILTIGLFVVGIVLSIKDYGTGVEVFFPSLLSLMLLIMSLICHSTEKEDLAYIHAAKQHAKYIEAGIVSDLDEYTYFCNQIAKANNKILKARANKDDIWTGYCYFESVANQELIPLDVKKNE